MPLLGCVDEAKPRAYFERVARGDLGEGPLPYSLLISKSRFVEGALSPALCVGDLGGAPRLFYRALRDIVNMHGRGRSRGLNPSQERGFHQSSSTLGPVGRGASLPPPASLACARVRIYSRGFSSAPGLTA